MAHLSRRVAMEAYIKFRLCELIGVGSSAEVWHAEFEGAGSVWYPTALKISFQALDSPEVQRDLKVLNAVRNLRHPHIIALKVYGPIADRLYVGMELAD